MNRCDAFRHFGRLATMLAVTLAVAPVASASQTPEATSAPQSSTERRPRIALVLSGGGARGAAHVGVLKVLDEMRIPIDYVVGTSMGSIVGGAYAVGTTPGELETRLRAANWSRVLSDRLPRPERSLLNKELDRLNILGLEIGFRDGEFRLPKGAIIGSNVDRFLDLLIGQRGRAGSFDHLEIPFRAIATDIATGHMVVLDQGDLGVAMRASMSVPGAFAPVEIDGKTLVDGGLVRNLGVDVARAMGAEVVIAVNVGTPLLKPEQIRDALSVSEQMVGILTEQNVTASLSQLRPGDVLITPALGDFSSTDFEDAASTIPLGEAAARKSASELARYSLSPPDYAALRQAQQQHMQPPPPLQVVRVETARLRYVNPKSVEAIMQTRSGTMPDAATLQRDVDDLYATDDFQNVRYHYEDQQGRRVLVIEPVEKEWGPTYLQFGLTLATNFQGSSSFNLLGFHRTTWMDSLGLEWRNVVSVGNTTAWTSELYQPLDYARTLFVAPRLSLLRRQENIYEGDTPVATYRVEHALAGLDLGLNFAGTTGQLRFGYLGGQARADPRVATPDFQEVSQNVGAVRALGIYDSLDNWAFPGSGAFATGEILWSREGLGASADYERASVELGTAFHYGRHLLSLTVRGGTPLGSELPVFEAFSLGGFLNLSGFGPSELIGQKVAFGRAVYHYRLGSLALLSNTAYLGGSVEAGNVYERMNGPSTAGLMLAGSLFVAADTTLGPAYLAFGVGQDGHYAAYFFLGRP